MEKQPKGVKGRTGLGTEDSHDLTKRTQTRACMHIALPREAHARPPHAHTHLRKRTPVYMMIGFPSESRAAHPEKQPSASTQPGVGTRAGGRWFQCTKSVLTAWPQTCRWTSGCEKMRVQFRERMAVQSSKRVKEAAQHLAAQHLKTLNTCYTTACYRRAATHNAKVPLARLRKVLVKPARAHTQP
jgi:hypothetical protein